jgi:hypothetical protein
VITGEIHADALALLLAVPATRAAMYCELQAWPPEYREQVFTMYDEVMLAEAQRTRGEIA